MNAFDLQITATLAYQSCAKCERLAITIPNLEVWLLCEKKIIFYHAVLCKACLVAQSLVFLLSLQSIKDSLNIHTHKRQRAKRKRVLMNDYLLCCDTVSKNFLISSKHEEYISGLTLPWWCK